MDVDVAREYFMFDEESKKLLGKGYPIGMSLMAFAVLFLATISFFVIFIPSIENFNDTIDVISLFVVPLLFAIAIYLYYSIIGNYLYYKGIWRDPPFAKRSVKVFWRDLKKGKLPSLVLPEMSEDGKVLRFHLFYSRLGNRGVVVEIDKEEKERIDAMLRELKIKGGKNIEFLYVGNRVAGVRIIYEDGHEERIYRKTAETLRFLYVLGKNKHTFMRSIKLIGDIMESVKK